MELLQTIYKMVIWLARHTLTAESFEVFLKEFHAEKEENSDHDK